MRNVISLAITLLFFACGGGDRRATRRAALRPLPFAIPGYRLTESDTVRGVTGVWASFQYDTDSASDRDSLRARIARSLEADGWVRDTGVADRPYVLSREYATGDDDLLYQRGPYPGEPKHSFHLLAVYCGAAGRPVCVYATTGW